MGLLDGALGNIVGGMMGGGKGGPAEAMLGGLLGQLGGGQSAKGGMALAAVMAMVQKAGGLNAILGKFKSAGMADAADSWVGTGANAPVSGAQMKQVLGGDSMKDLASKLGVDEDEASSSLATMLPGLVDKLTPNGKLEADSDDMLSKGLEMLKGMAK